MRTPEDAVMLKEAETEHASAKSVFDQLEAADPSSTDFQAFAKVLHELVDHHAGEEEEAMFPRAKTLIDEETLMELGAQMAARREELEQRFSAKRPAKGSYESPTAL